MTSGYHRDHQGTGEALEQRIASASWLRDPEDKLALMEIIKELVWLLRELDEVQIPWDDLPATASMAKLDDLKLHVANYVCGEGPWRVEPGPELVEYLGEGEES